MPDTPVHFDAAPRLTRAAVTSGGAEVALSGQVLTYGGAEEEPRDAGVLAAAALPAGTRDRGCHVDPLPATDDLVQVDRPFAEPVVRLLAAPVKDHGIDADYVVERMKNYRNRPQQRGVELVNSSGVWASPSLLLASLAGDPALRTEDGIQILENVVSQLAPTLEEEIAGFGPRHLDVFWSGRFSGAPDPVQMTLYLICREGLKKAAAEEGPSEPASR